MTHPAYSFLSQDEMDAARRSVSGMRKAADDFEFHFSVLKTFAFRMQSRVAVIEASMANGREPLKNKGTVHGEPEVLE